ncbi:MAG: beta-galactosidase [Lachnospiraceae bacterium]
MYSFNENYLMKDGKPILPVMGEFHFSRYMKEEWERALLNMKAGGVEIVATYIFWIHHEEARGEWDFTGQRCLRDFLECCHKCDIKVWLRIGPWAHGECRNGGFPDWLVEAERRGELKTRTNDEKYLKLVDELYMRIGKQAAGYMYKDGGPVIGVQIENEYGHCGGPSDKKEGMEHMNTLKKLAQKNGLIAPYYSATGWGGAYVPEGFLAVLGGYVDAPWAEHTHELPASENFLFMPFHDDANIGSDFKDGGNGFTFDVGKVPYLTAELGGGLQVTAHRRTYPYPEDIEAQTVCMLGAGANLIGYYMYHGGTNPDGRYTTLQESKATGYNNDLPVKSYDFQTCLRENGLPNESYYHLRKHHIFIKSTEQLLAPAKPYLPSNIPTPDSPEDMDTLRACFRYNEEADCGFLFINNHQRKRLMTDKLVSKEKPLCFEVGTSHKKVLFDNIHVKTDAIIILPYNLPVVIDGKELRLEYTNASYLGHLCGKYYFYSDEIRENVFFEWSDGLTHDDAVVLLTTYEAEHAVFYQYDDVEDSMDREGIRFLPEIQFASCGNIQYNVTDNNEYKLCIDYGAEGTGYQGKDIFLDLDFGGDRAELYEDGKLIADWFSNGEVWRVALKFHGYPKELTLKLYPYEENVYYDLPAKKECRLAGAKLSNRIV